MPQACRICNHAQRQAMEDALASGLTLRAVAARFGVTKDAAARHWHNHTGNATGEPADASTATSSVKFGQKKLPL